MTEEINYYDEELTELHNELSQKIAALPRLSGEARAEVWRRWLTLPLARKRAALPQWYAGPALTSCAISLRMPCTPCAFTLTGSAHCAT